MIKVETSDIEILKTLNAGDIVSISGTIYTARDAAHKKIFALMKDNEPLPFPPSEFICLLHGRDARKRRRTIRQLRPHDVETHGRLYARYAGRGT